MKQVGCREMWGRRAGIKEKKGHCETGNEKNGSNTGNMKRTDNLLMYIKGLMVSEAGT